jgi:hypothetical protein
MLMQRDTAELDLLDQIGARHTHELCSLRVEVDE